MRLFVPAFFADLFCNRLFVLLLQLHLQRGITVRTAVTDRKISSDMNRLMERRKPAAGKEAAG